MSPHKETNVDEDENIEVNEGGEPVIIADEKAIDETPAAVDEKAAEPERETETDRDTYDYEQTPKVFQALEDESQRDIVEYIRINLEKRLPLDDLCDNMDTRFNTTEDEAAKIISAIVPMPEQNKSMFDMTKAEILKICPKMNSKEANKYKKKIDFNEIDYDSAMRHYNMVQSLIEHFGEFNTHLANIIADYAASLFDGSWWTSDEVLVYELPEEGKIVGFFPKYLLCGIVWGENEFVFHQYPSSPHPKVITLFGKIDDKQPVLDTRHYSDLLETRKPLKFHRDTDLMTKAFKYAAEGCIELLEPLIKEDPDLLNRQEDTKEGENMKTLLMKAVQSDKPKCVEWLLNAKADPLLRTFQGKTALSFANDYYVDDCITDYLESSPIEVECEKP